MTKAIQFTVDTIRNLPVPSKGRSYYKDSKDNSFRIYVTSNGTKTYFVRKNIHGVDRKVIIGSAIELKLEQARNLATLIRSEIAHGKDPVTEQRKKSLEGKTFGQHFQEYMERYSKPHKKSWKYDEREVNKFLSHWFNRGLSKISKLEVQLLHENVYKNNGLYQANRILERIRTIYNKAIEWGWDGINPAIGVKKFKEPITRLTRIIVFSFV